MNRETWMIYCDVDNNNNKFWHIIQDGTIVSTKWGRVGDSPQTTTWNLTSSAQAVKEYDKKCRQKLKKGYEKVDAVGAINTLQLSQIALQEIDTDSETTKSLVKWLTEVNIHSIIENTTIQYNSVSGLFTTPLGVVVSADTILKAKILLGEISKHVINNDDSSLLTPLVNKYLRLIPQNVGRARDKIKVGNIFGTKEKIAKQSDILDSLEASLTAMTTQPKNGEATQRVFNCKLYHVNDTQIIDEINKFYQSTSQSIHLSSSFRLSKVYLVDIKSVRDEWEKDGVKMKNIRKLWHGTKISNLLSILKKGLIIPSSTAPHVSGRMFSDGLYFSDQATKSLNYSCGYWDNNFVNKCFMFLCDVALGKYYIPKNISDGPFPKPGYDSTFAQGGKSGVLNNEFIIPRTSMVNLVYLVEFSG
jgi:poly [ADP-ribose] polymerase